VTLFSSIASVPALVVDHAAVVGARGAADRLAAGEAGVLVIKLIFARAALAELDADRVLTDALGVRHRAAKVSVVRAGVDLGLLSLAHRLLYRRAEPASRRERARVRRELRTLTREHVHLNARIRSAESGRVPEIVRDVARAREVDRDLPELVARFERMPRDPGYGRGARWMMIGLGLGVLVDAVAVYGELSVAPEEIDQRRRELAEFIASAEEALARYLWPERSLN
jgi:hypothetical protein